jgi:hypothetical protein
MYAHRKMVENPCFFMLCSRTHTTGEEEQDQNLKAWKERERMPHVVIAVLLTLAPKGPMSI